MKMTPEGRLFWFLKEGTDLDLSDPATLEMVVQQVATCGRTEDVRNLLRAVPPDRLKQSFEKRGRFLPDEVRMFWEDFFAAHP